ncbi:hypothetical protein DKP76_18300 [Falsochrobactrum shanghaiense]|uniref:Uncharacterized protein n=1 Tax=Falsochrobactrum shanghaiense TaxID=2201899 RepID=A0A316J544_9HYPH|nr:hypothetical protein [Falsochrobactrum shanghaiense]PWL16288.1 hypothetical protein DKP76_18300 [Falsochrobactrum shanghaiense]
MFAETVVGYIDLIEHKIPVRSFKQELNASLHLSWLFNRIDRAHDRDSRKRAVRDVLLRWAIWNEGEKIFGHIEEASARAKVSGDTAPARSMPITRDTLNHVTESVASKSAPAKTDIEIAASTLPARPYAFDLLHYDAEQKQLRVLSMVYGISVHKETLCQWRTAASNTPSMWGRLASQYYGIDIEQYEFALIDPLLDESQTEEGIWALADLDRLIGVPGIAKKALNVQEALREELIVGIGDTFAKTEAEQARLIDKEIAKIAVEAIDNASLPQVQILTPDNASR